MSTLILKNLDVSTTGTINSILLKRNMVNVFANLPNSNFFPQDNCLNPQSIRSYPQSPSLYNMTPSLVKVGWLGKVPNWITLPPSVSNLEITEKRLGKEMWNRNRDKTKRQEVMRKDEKKLSMQGFWSEKQSSWWGGELHTLQRKSDKKSEKEC